MGLSRLLQPPNSFFASEDTAVVLLERGLKRTSGGWQFTRDPRLQIPAMDFLSLTDQLDAAEQITCPHLLIEAEEGAKKDQHSSTTLWAARTTSTSNNLTSLPTSSTTS